jgi:hypothetical protein
MDARGGLHLPHNGVPPGVLVGNTSAEQPVCGSAQVDAGASTCSGRAERAISLASEQEESFTCRSGQLPPAGPGRGPDEGAAGGPRGLAGTRALFLFKMTNLIKTISNSLF